MTAPDGLAAEIFDAFDADHAQATVLAFPGAFSTASPPSPPAADNTDAPVVPSAAPLSAPQAQALARLADERGVCVRALLDAARLLTGGDGPQADSAAAELALAAAGRGPQRLVPAADIEKRETRIEMLEYRNKALTGALERVSFQPLDGGLREVRDAAQIFGFANEWCFDEDRVTRRFRELAPVYHPDTGVVADRERMAQLIEARNLLIRHVRTAYPSGGWVGKRRG
jgi:hypothetical protein